MANASRSRLLKSCVLAKRKNVLIHCPYIYNWSVCVFIDTHHRIYQGKRHLFFLVNYFTYHKILWQDHTVCISNTYMRPYLRYWDVNTGYISILALRNGSKKEENDYYRSDITILKRTVDKHPSVEYIKLKSFPWSIICVQSSQISTKSFSG